MGEARYGETRKVKGTGATKGRCFVLREGVARDQLDASSVFTKGEEEDKARKVS